MKHLLHLFTLLCLLLMTNSCAANGTDEPAYEPQKTDIKTDTLSILAIGNSFTYDALSYLPYLFQKIKPTTHFTLGILYYPGGTLDTQYDHLGNNRHYTSYHRWTSDVGTWQKMTDSQAHHVLHEQDWSIITLQQGSVDSNEYANYTRHIDFIMGLLHEHCPGSRLAWMVTPAYADGYLGLTNGLLKLNGQPASYTIDQMFEAIAACARQLTTDYHFDLVLPCGTAVQNARHTLLGQYGVSGSLTYDGLHQQEGIGCFVEACAAFLAITRLQWQDATLTIQDSWNIPYPHGKVTGMGVTNQMIAWACAQQAQEHPFQVTPIP